MTARPSRVLLFVPGRTTDYEQVLTSIAVPGPDLELRAVPTAEAARALGEWPEIFLGTGLGPELLLGLPNLRWIQWVWAGVDTLTGDKAFRQALCEGLRLTRAAGIFGRSIAEYVLAWCLYEARNMGRSLAARRDRVWDRFEPGLLAGHRLGVAGVGSVGSEVARLAAALGLEVWGFRRDPALPPPPGVSRGFGPSGFDDFLAGVDYCVTTLPLTDETRGLFDSTAFAAMKPSSVFISVGRGGVVDEAALVEGLRAGRPGRAVLDVFRVEPLPAASPLWSLPNLVVTPHHAALSQPAAVCGLFLENLQRYRTGLPLAGQVRGETGY